MEVKEKLKNNKKNTIIYHSRNASRGEIVKFWDNIVEELIVKRKCMIIGDFRFYNRLILYIQRSYKQQYRA